tara:strand:+ start:1217 stop:1684 length:468 start_codon:yes stop_codon:yes gene_type:complete
VQRTEIRKDQRQHWRTTWQVPKSAGLIPILWFSGVDNASSGIVLQVALVLLAPTTVRLIRLRLTEDQKVKNLSEPYHGEALQQWSPANFDHLSEVGFRIAPNEADYYELKSGGKMGLEKCSGPIRDRASAMDLPPDFVCSVYHCQLFRKLIHTGT